MHASETFKILQKDESNILKSLSKDQHLTVRKNMVRVFVMLHSLNSNLLTTTTTTDSGHPRDGYVFSLQSYC